MKTQKLKAPALRVYKKRLSAELQAMKPDKNKAHVLDSASAYALCTFGNRRKWKVIRRAIKDKPGFFNVWRVA